MTTTPNPTGPPFSMHFEPQNQSYLNNNSSYKRRPGWPIFNHAASFFLLSLPLSIRAETLPTTLSQSYGRTIPITSVCVMVVYWKEQAVDVSVMDGDESHGENQKSIYQMTSTHSLTAPRVKPLIICF
jgi:hypothetical protein